MRGARLQVMVAVLLGQRRGMISVGVRYGRVVALLDMDLGGVHGTAR